MNFERQIERIVTPGVEIDHSMVPWDSEIFGFQVAQIEHIDVKPDGDPADGMAEFRSWLDRRDIRLVSCRLGSDRLRESMLLEANGFRFIEMVYSPVLTPIPALARPDEDLVIGEARPEDYAVIEAMAGEVFSTGRHVLDPRLDPQAGHARYRAWLRNSSTDPQQAILKATIGDELVGFFVVEVRPPRTVYWHLTAIASAWQGRGIGTRLWRAMVDRHRGEGLERIETTISAHNAPALNIYAGLGFKFGAPRMTFHWVRP